MALLASDLAKNIDNGIHLYRMERTSRRYYNWIERDIYDKMLELFPWAPVHKYMLTRSLYSDVFIRTREDAEKFVYGLEEMYKFIEKYNKSSAILVDRIVRNKKDFINEMAKDNRGLRSWIGLPRDNGIWLYDLFGYMNTCNSELLEKGYYYFDSYDKYAGGYSGSTLVYVFKTPHGCLIKRPGYPRLQFKPVTSLTKNKISEILNMDNATNILKVFLAQEKQFAELSSPTTLAQAA